MQLRRLVLPIAFLVLGGLSTGLVLLLRYPPVVPTFVVAIVTAVVASLIWMAAIGEDPNWRRGAMVAATASVLGPLVSLIPAKIALNVKEAVEYDQSLLDIGLFDIYLPYLVLTGAILLVPLAAAAGALATRYRGLAPPVIDTVDVPHVTLPGARKTRRQLGLLALVICVVVGAVAVVQYTDPTTPDVGDGPAYAGADAPASEQAKQALDRTRAVSHTVRGQSYRTYENGTTVERSHFVIRNDLQQDRVRYVHTNSVGNALRVVKTVDAVWSCWCDRDPSSFPPHDRLPTPGYIVELPIDGGVTVLNETSETVSLAFSTPQDWGGRALASPIEQTTTINRRTGRLQSMTIRWNDSDGGNRLWRIHFDDYADTSAQPPQNPGRPLQLHVYDLVHGPLNDRTPLLGIR